MAVPEEGHLLDEWAMTMNHAIGPPDADILDIAEVEDSTDLLIEIA